MSSNADDLYRDEGETVLPGFLRDPWGLLRRRFKWMLLVLVVGLGATGWMLHSMTPVFLGRATILVAQQNISPIFFQPTVENDQFQKISAIVGELLSRRNVVRLVTEHGLYATDADSKALTMEDRVALMRDHARIEPDRSRGTYLPGSSAVVYAVTFESPNRHSAANIANELATGFVNTHLEMRSRQAKLTTEFLQRELTQVGRELADAEREITAFKQDYRGELPGELETNMRRLDRLQQQRQSLALQIAEAETRRATLGGRPMMQDTTSPAARLAALRARYDETRAIYTEEHPNVLAVARQLAALEAEVERTGGATGGLTDAGSEATLAELRRQLAATEAEYRDLDSRVAMTPKRHEELAGLEQRADILRESHVELLRKVDQAELSEAIESAQQGERATILDRAMPPNSPANSPIKYVAVGVVASFLGAIGLGVLLEILDSVVVDATEIEREFNLPVLGSVVRIR